ncbi:hypothetical protein EMIT07CA2_550060 [Brevibacillus sp. IT-7CA2]|uniref:hypothetical protein n=1 Tax=Brevibacillus sp. IT-7CA2 TaxID=3026436 RepID=UPI0039E150B4
MSASKADRMKNQIKNRRTAAEIFVFGDEKNTEDLVGNNTAKPLDNVDQKPDINVNNDVSKNVNNDVNDNNDISDNEKKDDIINDNETVIVNTNTNEIDDNFNGNIDSEVNNEAVNTNDIDRNTQPDVVGTGNTLDLIAQIYNDKKGNKKTLKGFYLEPDVISALDKVKKKFGKGFQSDYVNQVLRQELQKAGFIKNKK